MPSVTYSPEDNKLRLYVGRVPRDEYEQLRAAGFISTPKQSCDFVATWTPDREDLAREYLDDGEDIGDEDYSPEERAADRAERFGEYRDKRATEAGASADAFESGPQAFGAQSLARAERQARRHDRSRVYCVSQWSKAEYWQQRTQGVIANALHKSSPSVRRGRILTLESEQRKQLSCIAANQIHFDGWQQVGGMEGSDEPLPVDRDQWKPAHLICYALANGSHCSFYHPSCEAANDKAREIWKHGFSLYDLLTKTEFVGCPFERLSPRDIASLYLAAVRNPSDSGTHSQRWAAHYEFRLEYEKAMLANEGGMAGEAEMEVGGWIRSSRGTGGEWRQIHKVNKSPATKRVTSVEVMGTHTGYTSESNYTVQETRACLCLVKVGRLGEDAYRPPTDEERASFAAEKKANKPAAVPTINPTKEDAQRLQDIWNAAAMTTGKTLRVVEVKEMTQAAFSGRLKYEYVQISEFNIGGERFKLRCARGGGFYDYSAARQVIVLTDKPQKPFPFDWDAIDAPTGELVEA